VSEWLLSSFRAVAKCQETRTSQGQPSLRRKQRCDDRAPVGEGGCASEFRVINIAANGPVVMTERVDVFKLPKKSFEIPVMGIFEISDGKIRAWRDYFDLKMFTSRMG
jgi:hypothetical protein